MRIDVIRLAMEAGSDNYPGWPNTVFLERFADLVAAAEREECAKVVSETVEWKSKGWTSTICPITKGAIAAAIRARKPA